GGVAPTARAGHGAAIVGNKMYIHGGWADLNTVLSDTWSLDLDTFEWAELIFNDTTYEITQRARHVFINSFSSLYVNGGYGDASYVATGDIFVLDDVNDPTWRRLDVTCGTAPNRAGAGAVIFTSDLYVWGGIDETGDSTESMFTFNFNTLCWDAVTTTGAQPEP